MALRAYPRKTKPQTSIAGVSVKYTNRKSGSEINMQRKMKLIRKLLEYTEMSTTEDRLPIPEFDEYSEAEVHYHVGLCEQAGFLEVYKPSNTEWPRRFPGISNLTWDGHEALDKMRSR